MDPQGFSSLSSSTLWRRRLVHNLRGHRGLVSACGWLQAPSCFWHDSHQVRLTAQVNLHYICDIHSVCLSIRLSIYLSICLSVCLSVYLSIFIHIYIIYSNYTWIISNLFLMSSVSGRHFQILASAVFLCFFTPSRARVLSLLVQTGLGREVATTVSPQETRGSWNYPPGN